MNIKFEKKPNGFSAVITGYSAEDLTKKVNECKSGECSCDCDPKVMEKIQNIEVASSQEGAKITVTTDVSIENIAPMMQACLSQKEGDTK